MLEASRPCVEVIVPCWNGAHFLTEAIESVLQQTYPHTSLTIVDDGSTDGTRAVVDEHAASARCLRIEHSGPSRARNVGVRATSSDLILFLDADDFLAVDAVEHHVESVRAHPEGSIFVGAWKLVDIRGAVTGVGEPILVSSDPVHQLLLGYCPPVNSVMVRKSALVDVGLFDEALRLQEDWDLWSRLAAAGHQFVPVPAAMAFYRRHADGSSARAEPRKVLDASIARIKKVEASHPNCSECRRIIGFCLADWRSDHLELLKQEVRSARSNGRTMHSLSIAAHGLLRMPSLASLVAQRWYRRRRRLRDEAARN